MDKFRLPEKHSDTAAASHSDSPIFLAPYPETRFRAEYFDRKPLAIRRNCPNYFMSVMTLGEIDELVTSVRIPATNLNMANGDMPLPRTAYCVGNDFVDKELVLAHHRDGATIILRAVEQWSSSLNRLRMAAERFFLCGCQINAYLTPPEKKSTPPHWDTHDLVVMQLSGTKVWRLYGGRRSLPLDEERFEIDSDQVDSNYEEVELVAGDTLYLPRGVIHEPIARDYSVHLSIGVHVVRWYQVLDRALRLLASQEGSMLRPAVTDTASGLLPASLIDELNRLTDPAVIQAAGILLQRQFESSKTRDRTGLLCELASVGSVSAAPTQTFRG